MENRHVAAPIDFYFEFASPYGYLASMRIDAIAAAHEREVTWRPIMLGAALKLTGGGPNAVLPLKGPYLRRDAPRSARLVGAPFALLACVAVALGGFGNVPATLAGGVVVGLVEVLGGLLIDPSLKLIGVFALYLLVVLWRPQGLFGRF